MTVHYCKKCKNVLVAVFNIDTKKYVLLCKTCSAIEGNTEDDYIYDLDENVLYNESSSKNIDTFDTIAEENLYDPICPYVTAKCEACKKNTKLKVFPYGQKKNYICTECKTIYKG